MAVWIVLLLNFVFVFAAGQGSTPSDTPAGSMDAYAEIQKEQIKLLRQSLGIGPDQTAKYKENLASLLKTSAAQMSLYNRNFINFPGDDMSYMVYDDGTVNAFRINLSLNPASDTIGMQEAFGTLPVARQIVRETNFEFIRPVALILTYASAVFFLYRIVINLIAGDLLSALQGFIVMVIVTGGMYLLSRSL